MNRSGKAATIILVITAILLLSLLAISLFFFKDENEKRKLAESQLVQVKASQAKIEMDLKDAKKQISLFEEKEKESDKKINDLMDELELQKGIREQMKTENAALKETMGKDNEDKENISKALVAAQEKLTALEEQLKGEETQRAELEAKIKEMEQQETQTGESVELERIIVTPGEAPQGRIVSVNKDNNFVIFNLGQEYGIAQDALISVFRGDKYLGDLKVTRVQAGMSVADFVAPLSGNQGKKDDRVVVKK